MIARVTFRALQPGCKECFIRVDGRIAGQIRQKRQGVLVVGWIIVISRSIKPEVHPDLKTAKKVARDLFNAKLARAENANGES